MVLVFVLAAADGAWGVPVSATSTGGTDLTTSEAVLRPAMPTGSGVGVEARDRLLLAASGATAYVANSQDDTVTPIDVATNTAGTPIPVGDRPRGVAATPDGTTVYVTNEGDGTVTPIDVATNTAGTPIPVGDRPRGVAATPDGTTVYVTNEGDGTVTPIDVATNTAGTPIPVGRFWEGTTATSVYPRGVTFTADGTTAYVAHGNGLTPIDVATSTAGTPIPITTGNKFYQGVAVTPDGATAYVTFDDGAWVTPIDLATRTVDDPIFVGLGTNDVAVTPDGATVYASSRDGLTPIDVATNTAGSPILQVGSFGGGVALTPDGTTVYVTTHFISSSWLTPVHVATNTAGTPISLGPAYPAYSGVATEVAVAPDGATAYVTMRNRTPGTVIPVDVATNTAGSPIPVGGEPYGVAVAGRAGVGSGGGNGDGRLVMASLGDSYSSGEGLAATYGQECGRSPGIASPGTYGQQLFAHRSDAAEFRFEACSGATAAGVKAGQLSVLDSSVDLVTLTAGGNTVGFAPVLLYCLAVNDCDQRFGALGSAGQDALSQKIEASSTYDDLYDLYEAIRVRARNATVMVLGYPQVIAPASERRSGCLAELDDDEIGFIRDHTDEMNGLIARVAADAGVRFVSVRDEFDPVLGGACGDWPKINEVLYPYVNGSFHPNVAGQAAYYEALVAAGASSGPLPLNPVPQGRDEPSGAAPNLHLGALTGVTVAAGCAAGAFLPAGPLQLVPRNCPVRAVVRGLGPAVVAHLRLFSDPVEVATATTDGDGTATFEFTPPADTALAAHTLVVEEPGPEPNSTVIAAAGLSVAELPAPPPLNGATVGPDGVSLAWDAPADTGGLDLVGYHVYRDGQELDTTDAGTLTYTDSAVVVGDTYTYQVAAVNDLGESLEPAPIDVTVSGMAGTVTDTGFGQPVARAWVAALRTSDFTLAGGTAADATGHYQLALPAGSYYLYVVDPTGAHTEGFHGPPTTVTVTSGAMTDADPQMASLRGSVAGTVTEAGSGTPIGGAWVIGINATTGATQRGAVANGSGQYSLGGLRPGSYRPVFVDPTGAHASRYFPDSVDFLGATSLAVTAGASTAANVALPTQSTTPGAQTLSGTVREAGTNTALGGVFVVALRASDFRNAGGAVTNASGQYSLNVAAGDYKLAFVDSTGLHNMEWHDNQPNTGLATATSVTAPAVTNAALDANTGTMAGTVTDDPSGTPLTGAWVVAIGPTGAIAGGAVTSGAGTYTIAGLAPGTYRATIVDPNGGRTQEYYNNSPDYAGATPINITAANTATINVALALP